VSDSGSISFDRAAGYYDRTRGLSDEGARRTTQLLAEELRDRGPVIEIGVGTGQLALPLHAAGLDVIGLDLSRSMMARLIEKSAGSAPPLVQGDATRLPFPDDTLGAAYFRWVLHLIPAWEQVVAELVRVVRPGGVVLASLGGKGSGPQAEIQDRFVQEAGQGPMDPAGLGWDDRASLDAAMVGVGATPRDLPVFTEVQRDGADVYMDALEDDLHSWTWSMPEAERLRVARNTRAWAVERFGPLDGLPRLAYEVMWRAYDVA
jgi:SAM-dependent methyltransferase